MTFVRKAVSRARLLHIVVPLTTAGFAAAAVEEPVSTRTVCFDAFVNWDFHHRHKLRGCKATLEVVQRTLDSWRLHTQSHRVIENGAPEDLRQFLSELPGKEDCDIDLVYLASHQSRAGQWDFTQRKVLLFNQLLAQTKIPAHPHRIVILDTCFADAVHSQSVSYEKLAPVSLFASTASEETPEVNFHTPQPIDFAHRYPAAFAWLERSLGRKWDGKISFLGFVWVETFLAAERPPFEMPDWMDFLEKCQATAQEFRKRVSQRDSSTLVFSVDQNPP